MAVCYCYIRGLDYSYVAIESRRQHPGLDVKQLAVVAAAEYRTTKAAIEHIKNRFKI